MILFYNDGLFLGQFKENEDCVNITVENGKKYVRFGNNEDINDEPQYPVFDTEKEAAQNVIARCEREIEFWQKEKEHIKQKYFNEENKS